MSYNNKYTITRLKKNNKKNNNDAFLGNQKGGNIVGDAFEDAFKRYVLNEILGFLEDIKEKFEQVGDSLNFVTPLIRFFQNLDDNVKAWWGRFVRNWKIALGVSSASLACYLICAIVMPILGFFTYLKITTSTKI